MRPLLLLALGLAAAASAQPADPAPPAPGWRGGVGAGLARAGGSSALVAATVRLQSPYGVGPLRVEGGATSVLALSPFGSGSVLTGAHVALGASAAAGPALVSVAAGPSLSSVLGETALGLYAGAQAHLVVLPALGVGAEAYTHVSSEASVVGLGLSFAFGRQPARALVPNPPPRPRPAR